MSGNSVTNNLTISKKEVMSYTNNETNAPEVRYIILDENGEKYVTKHKELFDQFNVGMTYNVAYYPKSGSQTKHNLVKILGSQNPNPVQKSYAPKSYAAPAPINHECACSGDGVTREEFESLKSIVSKLETKYLKIANAIKD